MRKQAIEAHRRVSEPVLVTPVRMATFEAHRRPEFQPGPYKNACPRYKFAHRPLGFSPRFRFRRRLPPTPLPKIQTERFTEMAMYVSARLGRQLAGAVLADVKAVRSISGALVTVPAGSLPTILDTTHIRFYTCKASELTAAKDTEDDDVISVNNTVTSQPHYVSEKGVPQTQTEVGTVLTSSPVLAKGVSLKIMAVRADSGSIHSFRARQSGNNVRFFSEKPLGSRHSDDAPTVGAPANTASGGALIIWQGSSADDDLDNLKKELHEEEIRLNRIRIVQSVLYSNLHLREAAVSKMERLQEEDSVVAGLEFDVEGVRLTVADLHLRKEDAKKVFKAQEVGKRYCQGIEDMKSIIKEAFSSLSEPDKQVMSIQLQKVLSESFSCLPQEEKVLVASAVKNLLKATGFDSSDESGSTKGPFEWLFGKLGLDEVKNVLKLSGFDSSDESGSTKGPFEWLFGKLGLDSETVGFLFILFLIWFKLYGDVEMARELLIGLARYGFPGPFKVWDEADERAHPKPKKTITVEFVFDIGNVKVKLSDSELTVAGLQALIDSQKTDLKHEVVATGRLRGFFSGISSWIGGFFSSPSKKTED